MERVWVSRSTKDRVFISVVGWILVNMYLAKKYFTWAGGTSKNAMSATEFQENVATALIHNQHLGEASAEAQGQANIGFNDPEDCEKHPKYKGNMCRFCFKRRTIYICTSCSTPGRSLARRETGKKGGEKWTDPGYMHFCKGDCFSQHQCGKTAKRRKRGVGMKDHEFSI